MKVIPDPTGPGRESVWSSYPRPAVAEPSQRRLKIVHRDVIIADTRKGIRTLETSHPPSYYFPPDDIAPFVLQPSRRRTFCEWKGEAIYFDVLVHGETLRDVAWSYPDPNPAFKSLRGRRCASLHRSPRRRRMHRVGRQRRSPPAAPSCRQER